MHSSNTLLNLVRIFMKQTLRSENDLNLSVNFLLKGFKDIRLNRARLTLAKSAQKSDVLDYM